MASAVTSEAYETRAEGLHVWTVREGTREVFAAGPERLRKASLPAYPEHLAWLNNTCLSLSVVSGEGPPDISPRRSLYLVGLPAGWQLTDARPPACRRKAEGAAKRHPPGDGHRNDKRAPINLRR